VDFLPGNFSLLIRRLGLLMLLYFVCRFFFLVFNFVYYSQLETGTLVLSFVYGLRFDITAVIISNILFISLHLFPFSFFYSNIYQRVLKIIFNVFNIPFLLLNCIDFGLFRFTGKRTGAEIFKIMSFGDDFINTVPQMIIDFWYLLLLFFLLIYLMNRFYPKMNSQTILSGSIPFFKSIFGKAILFLLFLSLTFIGFRGGIQYKPLNILSASRYGTGKQTALVLNTSFTVIKTTGKQAIVETHWMPDDEAKRISPFIKIPRKDNVFHPKNVVVIILESFGKEYIGALNNYKGYTPFLDSLMKQSLVFSNAFANGKRSIEGIPAIVAGLPALLPDPFITSAYSSNSITTIASLLKLKGYSSVFFHGGTNGTMGFDNFSKLAGYDRYFGRSEYNNDDDFDGSWGIYDEPFLKRTAIEMNKLKTPFHATIFTISSHHPYKIPDNLENKFPAGTLPIHRSIGYTDYSLKKFFKFASTMNWYKNTLFVITADHTALSEKPYYQARTGMYAVPIFFYCPGDSLLQGIVARTTQHIDILPGIMDYLGYDKSYFAFGNSMLDEKKYGNAINYIDDTYQLISDHYSYILDNTDKHFIYDLSADSTLKKDISGADTLLENRMDKKLKSFIQNFNHAMIFNEMK
jgi:phosphoglycerol transferase MdoB-like AlkP superfamily enzyme